MIRTLQASGIALAACLVVVALVASPLAVGAFPLSRIPAIDSRPGLAPAVAPRHYPRLYSAVDLPTRPMEEEKEKHSKKDRGDGHGEEPRKDWKEVAGGFVPNFLKQRETDTKYPTVQMVDTLEDYKRVVVDETERMVVVRFFAPWCKSCKAAQPLFRKMVAEHSPGVKFVEVPLTKETAYIHEGLGVPSVPFGHIYHPEGGLVEEKKISKKVFKEFREAVDSYVRGSCDLPIEEEPEEDGFQ